MSKGPADDQGQRRTRGTFAHAAETHYLRVYMAQLRRKLEPDPARPQLLVTEPGVGYRLRDER